MATENWQLEALRPFMRAVRLLYDAACSQFPHGILDERSEEHAVSCDQLRAWIMKTGKLFGGRSRKLNANVDSVVSGLGSAIDHVLSTEPSSPSGLLGIWPTRLLGPIPDHLVPVHSHLEWEGLFPSSIRMTGECVSGANATLEQMEEQEFAAAFLVPDADPEKAKPRLVALALEFRLHALRLAHWAKRQIREIQDALCPRIRLGDLAGKLHFQVVVTLAGFVRRLKIPDKQAELLAKLIRRKGLPVSANKHKIRALRKNLPEISTFISDDGKDQYKLASEVCARAKFASCWQAARPAAVAPAAADLVITPKL